MITSAPKASIWRTRSTELPREIKATNGCPMRSTDDGQPSPRVAAGELDDGLPGLQLAGGAGLPDDLQRDPIFLASAWAEVLKLDQQTAGEATGLDASSQLDQRRVTDHVEYGTSQAEEAHVVHCAMSPLR